MKSILIIGLGRFGQHLCRKLAERGNQIMVIDEKEENVEAVMSLAASAQIGDCTRRQYWTALELIILISVLCVSALIFKVVWKLLLF